MSELPSILISHPEHGTLSKFPTRNDQSFSACLFIYGIVSYTTHIFLLVLIAFLLFLK